MTDDKLDPQELDREPSEEPPTIDFSDVAEPLDRRHALILEHLSPDLLRFQLPWANPYNLPRAVKCEIDANSLLRMNRLLLLEMVRQNFGVNGWDYESFGKSDDPNWLQQQDELLADEDFLKSEQDAFFFFLTHFPMIATYAYMITLTLGQVSVLGPTLFEANPTEKERFLRGALDRMLQDLKKEIKEILGTRPSGRPKKLEPKEGLPKIVHNVLSIAEEMMGAARGKEDVPGLKEIANKLNLTENALGKQLGRAGYSWTTLRTYLENRT